MKMISKGRNISAGLLLVLASTMATSCQLGIEREPAPEEYYTDVDLYTSLVYSRYLFTDCVYGKNYGKYTTYIAQTSLQASSVQWTNNTGADYTVSVNGEPQVIANGQTVTIPNGTNNISTRDDASAPDGKVYVLTYYLLPKVTYSTANKGFLFDLNKYTGSDHFELVNGEDGKAEKVIGDVNPKQLVISLVPDSYQGTDMTLTPVNGAPALGTPADYSVPRQYMLKNEFYRPDGVPQAQRLYEVQVVMLPE